MNSVSSSTLALQLQTCTAEDANIVRCSGRLTAEVTAILRAEVKEGDSACEANRPDPDRFLG